MNLIPGAPSRTKRSGDEWPSHKYRARKRRHARAAHPRKRETHERP